MKKIIICSAIVCMMFFIPIKSFCIVNYDEISAKSVCVIEASSGTVLYCKNENEKLPEASTTKIMTTLIALENKPLDTVTEISANASNTEGSGIGLCEGDEVLLSDLLYMLMLKSGNDAAVAIAECVGGSIDGFAEMMNERAAKIGCQSTNFTNPHGLPDENHYTTASDLCKIAAEAYKNPIFRQIVSTKAVKLQWNDLVITNSNRLLALFEGANGMKTGYTKAAGRCLVSSAERNGISLICVTLSAPDDWNDHEKLLSDCFERIEKDILYEKGEYTAFVHSLGGNKNITVTNKEPIYCLKLDGKFLPYKVIANLPVCKFAPVKTDEYIGRLIVSVNGNNVSSTSLYSIDNVECEERKLTLWERIRKLFG